jgi:methylated-DNA-[protein]-cysteine S-methyltransferase
VDFSDVACELPGERTFGGLVLLACRRIPYDQTSSYGELARKIRRPDAARAVAGALGKNPLPLVVPCHRVTYADGSLGGFSAPGGVDVKRRMLALEAAARDR